ncbi:helix-turn-helix domain-containing protein [Paenibacillus sp. D2_2]|uniref:helix-turn-helix transcriptional regulator n=1 Tax=Paenibacillus sp. D2_2 TaxID=3073092 RepID=UPI00281641F8|nr:helix-turn-helix domain-containing protein [Paenibacillus sp. D2_2]WMT43025.1 helix-turn-helix domain-containing protein [Paenibacillus sp. D2_2]
MRIEREEDGPDRTDAKLMAFALTNIMEELLEDAYDSWTGEDMYGHLMFVVKRKVQATATQPLDRISDQFLRIVRHLYRFTVSVIISPEVAFPTRLQQAYQQCVASIRQFLGDERDTIITVGAEPRNSVPSELSALYSLPLFVHLLEAGQWDAALAKLEDIAGEWRRQFNGSYEHLMEIYHSLSASFFFLIHKNGKRIIDYRLASGSLIQTIDELQQWASELISEFRSEMQDDLSRHRKSLVAQVQQYIQSHLSADLCLQTIADRVHLHPVYLSKVYKKETGENMTEYVYQLRMDKALSLLNNRELKVYEVAEQVGYNNPAYFIRVFKNHFNVTPQEYRGDPPKG